MLCSKTEYEGRSAEHLISGQKLRLADSAGWKNKNRLNSGIVLYLRLLKVFQVEPEEEFGLGYNTLKT